MKELKIDVDKPIVDISTGKNLALCSFLTGDVELYTEHTFTLYRYKIDEEDSSLNFSHLNTFNLFKNKSCHRISYLPPSNEVVGCSKRGRISALDIEVGKNTFKCQVDVKGTSCLNTLLENIFALGSENGELILVDRRAAKKPMFQKEVHMDYISGILYSEYRKSYVASSGDGSISIMDIRKPDSLLKTDSADEGFTGLVGMKSSNGSDFLVTSGDCGSLNIYRWGYWGEISDRFIEHKCGINDIISVDEDRNLITAGDDGVLRVLHLQPHFLVSQFKMDDEYVPEKVALINHASISEQCVVTTSFEDSLRIVRMGAFTSIQRKNGRKTISSDKSSSEDESSTKAQKTGGFFDDL